MKVLLGTDGSGHSRFAEALVTKLALPAGSSVEVVSVAPTPVLGIAALQPLGGLGLVEATADLWQSLRKHATDTVDSAVGRLQAAGVHATPLVLEGDAGSMLIERCGESGVDLLVVGGRGLGAVAAVLLGSVARKLVAKAPCSVLVARAPKDVEPDESESRMRARSRLSVLVGVDGSPGSDAAIEFVAGFGNDAWERIHVLCVEPLLTLPPEVIPRLPAAELQADLEESERIARAAAERIQGAATDTTHSALVGRPGTMLMESASHKNSDLLVLGANRHSLVERVILGSVSQEVAAYAPCSVAVVRNHA